jgi:hypothetical protein
VRALGCGATWRSEQAESGGRGPDRRGTARAARRGHIVRSAEQGRGKGADRGPERHSAGRHEFKLDSKIFQMNSNLPKFD